MRHIQGLGLDPEGLVLLLAPRGAAGRKEGRMLARDYKANLEFDDKTEILD